MMCTSRCKDFIFTFFFEVYVSPKSQSNPFNPPFACVKNPHVVAPLSQSTFNLVVVCLKQMVSKFLLLVARKKAHIIVGHHSQSSYYLRQMFLNNIINKIQHTQNIVGEHTRLNYLRTSFPSKK